MTDPLQALLDQTLGAHDAFSPDSRYYGLPTRKLLTAEGREIRYVTRRFIPPASAHAPIGEHVVTRGDRLDTIAATHLGNAEQFWRICDANDAMRPSDLVATPGRRLRIGAPPGVPAQKI